MVARVTGVRSNPEHLKLASSLFFFSALKDVRHLFNKLFWPLVFLLLEAARPIHQPINWLEDLGF